MSQVLVTESYLDDIADAIRDKNGSEDTYTPAQMAGAIGDIHTADEVVLVSKSVTANGTYNPASDSADGYSGVTVDVPNSYSASDEGKVVSNGDLIAQTTKQITANGTHDTTTNNSISVDVPNSYTTSDNGKVVVNQELVAQTSKNINANGTHDTTSNNSVVVDVPNSYAAADEGKVVSGGTLVGQTSRNITINGTYDTTENNEVVVNVSGGGSANIITGYGVPDSNIGSNGSIYLRISSFDKLSYIENDTQGYAYIDTGFYPTGKTKVEMKVSASESIASWFGMWNNAYNNGAYAFTNDRSGLYIGYANNGGTSGSLINGDEHIVVLDKGIAYVDDTIVRSYNQDNNFIANQTLTLFLANRSGNKTPNYNYNRKFRLHYCKIYDDDVLVMDIIPVLVNNNACLYDLMNNNILYGGNNTPFIAGEIIGYIAEDDTVSEAYCKVNGIWRNLIGTNIDDINI